MKVRVLFKSPFSYSFNSDKFYVSAGQSKYLDTDVARDKKELDYLLSNSFPYSSWIYIEDKDIQVLNGLGNQYTSTSDILSQDVVILDTETEQEYSSVSAIEENVEQEAKQADSIPSFIDREQRKKELVELHYKKIEALLRGYGLSEYSSYSEKEAAIEAILEHEYT